MFPFLFGNVLKVYAIYKLLVGQKICSVWSLMKTRHMHLNEECNEDKYKCNVCEQA